MGESEKTVYDVLIVGGGPAGLSAATALARQLHTTVIFDDKRYHNDGTKHMHNVATWDHQAPGDFRAKALDDALTHYQTNKYAAVEIKEVKRVVDGDGDGDGDNGKDSDLFELVDGSGTAWRGRKLILAHGVADIYPAIEGYAECWVRGIFHCLFCHGYEERGKPSSGVLAVDLVASPPHALTMARNAAQLSDRVTIYTSGNDELTGKLTELVGDNPRFTVEPRRVTKLIKRDDDGSDASVTVVLEDGTEKTEAFIAHQPRTRVRGPFVGQLGLETLPSGEIKTTPPFQQTSVRGVFAAGDCASPFKVVLNAMSSGSMAGAASAMQLQADKHGQTALF